MEAGALVAYCRGGFEGEAAADLRRIAAQAAAAIDIAVDPGAAYVIAHAARLDRAAWDRRAKPPRRRSSRAASFAARARSRSFRRRRFPRPRRSRHAASRGHRCAGANRVPAPPWRSAWIEFPDTNDGKALSPLARALGARSRASLRSRGQFDAGAARRLHVFLPAGDHAYVGTASARASDWPLGIPRLRMPRRRAVAVHAEARRGVRDVPRATREPALLRPGLRAVDLGRRARRLDVAARAARRARDGGRQRPAQRAVADDPLVTHLREDGLRWRPRRPVDWLVCDIVEQPSRIAELVARWIADGAARRAIFNLKLPMKKRYDEVRRCEQRIGEILDARRRAAYAGRAPALSRSRGSDGVSRARPDLGGHLTPRHDHAPPVAVDEPHRAGPGPPASPYVLLPHDRVGFAVGAPAPLELADVRDVVGGRRGDAPRELALLAHEGHACARDRTAPCGRTCRRCRTERPGGRGGGSRRR